MPILETDEAPASESVASYFTNARDRRESRRADPMLYGSEPVIVEAVCGHSEATQKRLALLTGIALLRITEEARSHKRCSVAT